MTISLKSHKILWSAAAGRCSFPDCSTPLISTTDGVSAVIGEMAHICGDKRGAARYAENQDEIMRDSHENLILLCPTHHTLIDKAENVASYTVSLLKKLKNDHEELVAKALQHGSMNKSMLVSELSMCAAQNKVAWEEYGPLSERAQKQPHNDRYAETWRYKRLTVIVPNNRKMAALLNRHYAVFEITRHSAISKFLEHVNSYECWVNEEDEYGVVVGYPQAFDEFLKEESNASNE
jgi:hypothetical protein